MHAGDEEVASLALSTVGEVLECLSINDSEITREALRIIQENCPQLRRLDISFCHGITEHSMVDMITFMPRLKALNCRGCRGIPKDLGDATVGIVPCCPSAACTIHRPHTAASPRRDVDDPPT